MAEEYQSSFTGQEIDERLQKAGKAVLVDAQSLTDAEKQQARENIGVKGSGFSGSYNDLTNVPSEFAPAAHGAAKITGGTFGGAVVANSAGQAPGTSLVRNSKLVAEEATPTVNGEIFWVYG